MIQIIQLFKLIKFIHENNNLILNVDCSPKNFKITEILLRIIGFNGCLVSREDINTGSIIIYDCNDSSNYRYGQVFDLFEKKYNDINNY